jgi:hypothetical protein
VSQRGVGRCVISGENINLYEQKGDSLWTR